MIKAGVENHRQSYRNRWLVAYTLLRNPSLQKLTASNIAKERQQLPASPSTDNEAVILGTMPIVSDRVIV